MIIVKLTILAFVISAIYLFAIRIWVKSNPLRAIKANAIEKYPKWMYGFALFVVLDIVGILASTVWFLFIRQAGGLNENYFAEWKYRLSV